MDNAPVITSIEEGNEELTVRFALPREQFSDDLLPEYQLDDGAWLKAENTTRNEQGAGLHLHQWLSYSEGVYATGIEENELGVIKEMTIGGDFDLSGNDAFTLSIKTHTGKENVGYSGVILKGERGAVGIYHSGNGSNRGVSVQTGGLQDSAKLFVQVFIEGDKMPETAHYVLSYLPGHVDGFQFFINGELKSIRSTLSPEGDSTGEIIDLERVRRLFGINTETSGRTALGQIRLFQQALTQEEIRNLFQNAALFSTVIKGLRNGKNYSVKVRTRTGTGIGSPSNLFFGMPADRARQIVVEDYRDRFDGDETQMIDRAIADGRREGKQVVFGGREYGYRGRLRIRNGTHDLQGIPGETVVKVSNRVLFESNDFTKVFGICFDGDSQSNNVGRVTNTDGGTFEFEQCQFKGAYETTRSGFASSIHITSSPEHVLLKDCVISDSESEKHSGSDDTPVCSGLHISATTGTIVMEGGEITRVGNRVTDSNGVSIWDERGNHGGGLGLFDLRCVAIQSTSHETDDNREIHFRGVTFSEARKRFIKANYNTKFLFIEDCLFHIKQGKKCNQPIVLQSSHTGNRNYSGHIINCTFRIDSGFDLPRRGQYPALVSLVNNRATDEYLLKDNHIEVLDDEAPDGRGLYNVFSIFTTTGLVGAVHNITIENTTVDAPGGFTSFIFLRPSSGLDEQEARERGVYNLVLRNNVCTTYASAPVRMGSPANANCDGGRIYTFYEIHWENNTWDQGDNDGHVQQIRVCPDVDPDHAYIKDFTFQ